MKKFLFRIAVCFSKLVAPVFYSREYLSGRWFEDECDGWMWALSSIWKQKVLGFNRKLPFPCSHLITIGNADNLFFHNDNLDNMFSPGCYFQNFRATITIGRGVYIAPNVGLITSNHDFENLDEHCPAEGIVIGDNCWIGMNSVIMPGVTLAEGTIVGAGAIVTRSVMQPRCIVVGSPAKLMKSY